MARKQPVRFVCGSCGAVASNWTGRCNTCGEWNTIQEEVILDQTPSRHAGGKVLPTENVSVWVRTDQTRLLTGISEIDEVLGGGIVAGSVNLIAGQPGIGKSTLLLQLAYAVAAKHSVLYVSGEESAHQIGLRAERLGTNRIDLQLATSTVTDDIVATIKSGKFQLVIVDSIQTVVCSGISSAPGSITQITNSTQVLTQAAKQADTAIFLVGHVTKEGSIAGPKILEHVVDVVLNMEGDRYSGFKILRAAKNRFGSTNEAGIFEMTATGLKSVDNPSASLLAERQITDGSVVLATMEGSRPLLVEVQALVNKTSYGYPKRTAVGIDLNRVNLLVAVLERRTKLNLADMDIYVNIVGGVKISEPAADLAVAIAIGSAAKGLKLKSNSVVFGEVGLSGEIRHVPNVEKRIAEAKKLGFTSAIGPSVKTGKKMSLLTGVPDLRTALNKFLEKN